MGGSPATRPRVDPYALVFGEAGLEEAAFPAIQAEATSAGIDPGERERFGFMRSVRDLLVQMMPAEPPGDAADQFRATLFHGFNFWRAGRPSYLLEAAVARFLVEAAPALDGWGFALPHPSIYLQLPANLFWASVDPEARPEAIDGFWLAAPQSRAAGRPLSRLDVLMTLGVRHDRAGFGVIPFETEIEPRAPARWSAEPSRADGTEFAPTMPGGDLAGLYSITTPAEMLKLVVRALWYIDQHPTDIHPGGDRRVRLVRLADA